MSWDKNKFYRFIIDNEVIGFFEKPLKLKSGRLSHWYVNWRTVAEDVYSLDKLTDFIINFVKSQGLNPNCFYGVPEGAKKLGMYTIITTQYSMRSNQKARIEADFMIENLTELLVIIKPGD